MKCNTAKHLLNSSENKPLFLPRFDTEMPDEAVTPSSPGMSIMVSPLQPKRPTAPMNKVDPPEKTKQTNLPHPARAVEPVTSSTRRETCL